VRLGASGFLDAATLATSRRSQPNQKTPARCVRNFLVAALPLQLTAATRSGAAGSLLLNRRTWHRAIGAIDAAGTSFRLQPRATILAVVDVLAGIGRHCFHCPMSALRAGNDGLKFDHEDRSSNSDVRPQRPNFAYSVYIDTGGLKSQIENGGCEACVAKFLTDDPMQKVPKSGMFWWITIQFMIEMKCEKSGMRGSHRPTRTSIASLARFGPNAST
jgi:hypothetical protein